MGDENHDEVFNINESDFSDDDLLPLPVTNWSEDGPQVSYIGAGDVSPVEDSPLELPRSLDEILALDLEKRQQSQPEPLSRPQFVTNEPVFSDEDLLPLPVTNYGKPKLQESVPDDDILPLPSTF